MNIGGAKAMACMRRQKQSARSVLCGPGALCAQFSEKSGRDLFGDVPQPLFLAVADVDEGHLREFVAAQNQVDPERREVPDKRRDEAERHENRPHPDEVAEKAEAGIAARAENAAHEAGVHRGADDVNGADPHHDLQVLLCLLGELDHRHDDRVADQDDDAAEHRGQEGQPEQALGVALRAGHVAGADRLAEDDRRAVCDAEAEHRSEVAHHRDDRVRGDDVLAEVAHDDRVHREGEAPDEFILYDTFRRLSTANLPFSAGVCATRRLETSVYARRVCRPIRKKYFTRPPFLLII